jgi:hypothetical protein
MNNFQFVIIYLFFVLNSSISIHKFIQCWCILENNFQDFWFLSHPIKKWFKWNLHFESLNINFEGSFICLKEISMSLDLCFNFYWFRFILSSFIYNLEDFCWIWHPFFVWKHFRFLIWSLDSLKMTTINHSFFIFIFKISKSITDLH